MFFQNENLDKIILVAANAITLGVEKKELAEAIIDRGWSQEETYLLIKAGELLAYYRERY